VTYIQLVVKLVNCQLLYSASTFCNLYFQPRKQEKRQFSFAFVNAELYLEFATKNPGPS